MCHYRHHAHPDPFYYPGLQDITAHVDFTAMALAAQDAGADVLGYLNQSGFLLGAGIGELLLRTDPADAALPAAGARHAEAGVAGRDGRIVQGAGGRQGRGIARGDRRPGPHPSPVDGKAQWQKSKSIPCMLRELHAVRWAMMTDSASISVYGQDTYSL
jgi:hypothetical protein